MTGKRPALVFSALAALFYGAGLLFLPPASGAATALFAIAAGPVAALALWLAAHGFSPFGPAARLLAALWPPAALTAASTGMGAAHLAHLAALGLWPFVLAALAAGLALMPADAGRKPVPTLALFPLGAALAGCAGTVLALLAPALARLCLATPYHFVIFLTFCTVLVALSDAAATTLAPPRDRLIRALIALMPLLGFLGTVAGLIEALSNLPDLFAPQGADDGALTFVLHGLSTAFETTLIGLIGAALTGFLLTLLTDREAGSP